MHMFDEHALNTTIKGNLNFLCDVETFLGLSYIIQWMYAIFVKVCSSLRCICDFVDAIKACERDLYKLYVNPIINYGHANGVLQNSLQLCIIHMIPYIWFGFFYT
jgi:hypothetical protein